MAWIAKEDTVAKVVERVGKYAASKDHKDQFIGACYAVTLTRRPVPESVNLMADLLTPDLEPGVRNALGHAIGVTGLSGAADAEKKLFDMLKNPELRLSAALALILGAPPTPPRGPSPASPKTMRSMR